MKCRVCGGSSFGDVIDLGAMPLVNNLLTRSDAPCPRWPLRVVFCRACTLSQLTEAPPPDVMFREYCYFSSQSQTMVAHAQGLVERFVEPGQRVVEIASNDGYLLQPALRRGATVLGVEPARNVALAAETRGVPTRCDYFDAATATDIAATFGPADVLFANNVLAHVPDPNEIAAGIAILLAPDAVAHVEVPSMVRLVANGAFDTIYHEHHSYFTVGALRILFARHGLRIVGVEETPVHGGSLHVRVARDGDETEAKAWCERETTLGVADDAYYAGFASRVRTLGDDLRHVLGSFDPVAAYGAAAKGVVLLNAFDLTTATIPWVADVSPHKQGRYVPGTRQPIVSPAALLEHAPEACLLLPWNLETEITQRNLAYTDAGGRFIVPIPEVRVLDATDASLASAR